MNYNKKQILNVLKKAQKLKQLSFEETKMLGSLPPNVLNLLGIEALEHVLSEQKKWISIFNLQERTKENGKRLINACEKFIKDVRTRQSALNTQPLDNKYFDFIKNFVVAKVQTQEEKTMFWHLLENWAFGEWDAGYEEDPLFKTKIYFKDLDAFMKEFKKIIFRKEGE